MPLQCDNLMAKSSNIDFCCRPADEPPKQTPNDRVQYAEHDTAIVTGWAVRSSPHLRMEYLVGTGSRSQQTSTFILNVGAIAGGTMHRTGRPIQ